MTSDDHAWVGPYLARVLEFFGFGEWYVKIVPAEHLEAARAAETGYKTLAICDANWPYREAVITIDQLHWERNMRAPDGEAECLIIHECLHIVLSQLGHAMKTLISTYFPPDDGVDVEQCNAMSIYQDHEEYLISLLTSRFYEAIGPAIVEQDNAA